MYLIVGLGNPGEEYERSRHNTGRIVLEFFRKKYDFSEWEESSKKTALFSKGRIGKKNVELLTPETFMNKSGSAVLGAVTKHKIKSENLVVIYDDLDLPRGVLKISFNKGTGGHKGLESIVKSIKTKKFVRVRVGISQVTPKGNPASPAGRLKKPRGEQKILDYLMANFSKKDLEILKKLKPKIAQILETIILNGRQKAMNLFN